MASALPEDASMTTTTTGRSATLVRWVFQKGRFRITCSMDMVGDGSAFDVYVLPHWKLQATTVERFADARSAFEHHAELAQILREAGWVMAQDSPRHALAAA
jgi:hypothetical protein